MSNYFYPTQHQRIKEVLYWLPIESLNYHDRFMTDLRQFHYASCPPVKYIHAFNAAGEALNDTHHRVYKRLLEAIFAIGFGDLDDELYVELSSFLCGFTLWNGLERVVDYLYERARHSADGFSLTFFREHKALLEQAREEGQLASLIGDAQDGYMSEPEDVAAAKTSVEEEVGAGAGESIPGAQCYATLFESARPVGDGEAKEEFATAASKEADVLRPPRLTFGFAEHYKNGVDRDGVLIPKDAPEEALFKPYLVGLNSYK